MKTHATTDVEALARGHIVSQDAFQSIFADPEAVAELARLLQVSQVLGPLRDEPIDAGPPVEMEHSFEDLARFGEDRIRDPKRRQAIHDFLERHELLAPLVLVSDDTPAPFAGDAPTKHDTVSGSIETETEVEPRKPIPPPQSPSAPKDD